MNLVPGAAQHAVVRCRPGIVANSEFGKAPDLRSSTSLPLVLQRVRGTSPYPAALTLGWAASLATALATSLANVSRSPMVRMNTGLPGCESGSLQK